MNDEIPANMKLWEVYILPNNQPTIPLGDYYAVSAETAMEMAAIDHMLSVDDCFGATLKL